MSIETDVLVVKKKFKSTDSIQCILPIHCFSSWNQFWVCSSCLRLKQLPPRCSSARVTAVCESETLTSTMFFSLWSQLCDSFCLSCLWSQLWVCESFSVMLTTVCVEKVETKCVSLKHLPQRCCSACGANCESALLLMLCWQPSASKRWKQKIHLLFLYWWFQQCGKLWCTKPSAVRVLSWDN